MVVCPIVGAFGGDGLTDVLECADFVAMLA